MTDAEKALHDLKNYLSIILGFSELLITASASDDQRRRDLEEIRKAALAAMDRLARVFPRRP